MVKHVDLRLTRPAFKFTQQLNDIYELLFPHLQNGEHTLTYRTGLLGCNMASKRSSTGTQQMQVHGHVFEVRNYQRLTKAKLRYGQSNP